MNEITTNKIYSAINYLTNSPWLYLILAWILVWKGLALWQSARRGQKIWFSVILILNTLGILEIVYLGYFYFKDKKTSASATPTSMI
jgi:hypothetical protein